MSNLKLSHCSIMNLAFSALFLILGSFLSSSATSVEECRALVTPLSTFEPQLGRWNFVLGFIDSKPHQVLFKTTQTQWIEYVKTGSDSQPEYQQLIGIKHTTYCKYGTFPMTFHSNSAVMDKSNFTCTYQSLPTCEDCLLYLINARNNDIIVNSMDNPDPQTISQVKHYRAFYMMTKGNSIKHSDFLHAMKQARCLGFTGEPDRPGPASEYCEKQG
ncbi:uncharacterized protein LOC121512187 [Cheilinus undulatus]|uniref:uncharacterized protein LOC121512187 n=1 Tax=Cheilinus undulatus TaxID=241271 RepID=UPI001BD1F530|nr:uncharacterized protein LOC121512187 [Cheilinus undulatus]